MQAHAVEGPTFFDYIAAIDSDNLSVREAAFNNL